MRCPKTENFENWDISGRSYIEIWSYLTNVEKMARFFRVMNYTQPCIIFVKKNLSGNKR